MMHIYKQEYQHSHGKNPRGFGRWAFKFETFNNTSEPVFFPASMYSDAAYAARAYAKQIGATHIWLCS